MKPGRQSVILELIAEQDIETQFDLMNALLERGIKSTQATLSRDIRDLRLVKETGSNGKTRYARSRETETKAAESRRQTILRESVLSVDVAQNLVVIKTLPGVASGACSVLDGMEHEGMVGSLAGDDTAFIAFKDNTLAEAFYRKMTDIL